MSYPVLSVRNLCTEFATESGTVTAVNGVSFDVDAGETLAIVGESGCGKSVTSLSILGLLPPKGRIAGGEVLLEGRDMLSMSDSELREVRGSEVSMVFQDSLSSLNPVVSVGRQIAEALRAHRGGLNKATARARAIELLEMVGIPNPRERSGQYPHQFSGGMRQRAMIAMAMANEPKVLIADEPTTALDVTIQAQILEVLRMASLETGAATMFITHDLGVVAEIADRVAVMYAGNIVEQSNSKDIFDNPHHPYTVGLLNSMPGVERSRGRLIPIPGQPPNLLSIPPGCAFSPRCSLTRGRDICIAEPPPLREAPGTDHYAACHFLEEVPAERRRTSELAIQERPVWSGAESQDGSRVQTLLRVEGLSKEFPIRRGSLFAKRELLKAVDDVSFSIGYGETLGLVGESGSGKSTTGRLIMRLLEATSGKISFDGHDITKLSRSEMRPIRRQMQLVFQDPYSSLNPRMTVEQNIAEPLRIHGVWRSTGPKRIRELMDLVGLRPEMAIRFPSEFSGGQRQRVGIARAIALHPKLLVLDEPVSALDVSIQAQTINLLEELQRELGLSYLFIAHDLSVIRHISHNMAVMYHGSLVEYGPCERIYTNPEHSYTRALLAAAPISHPSERTEVPKVRERRSSPGRQQGLRV
jgi:peptide/nickel transport system ATP-binding protein